MQHINGITIRETIRFNNLLCHVSHVGALNLSFTDSKQINKIQSGMHKVRYNLKYFQG